MGSVRMFVPLARPQRGDQAGRACPMSQFATNQTENSLMSLGERYLIERGISLDTARKYGIELDSRVSSEMATERLGRGWPRHEVNEVLWFPLYDSSAKPIGWIARPLPDNALLPKFVCATGSDGSPYISKEVWEAGKRTDRPIVISEGPVKALVLCQAGIPAIGLNGVWMGLAKNGDGMFCLRSELLALKWLGRRVDLALDADQNSKPEVLQALIRTAFAFNSVGAQLFQLTSWPEEQKGIDDYLA